MEYKINGSFICERCRKICKGDCHEKLSSILCGEVKEGSAEYERDKDLIGRKQIIRCLGPYCDSPCEYRLDDYTPYEQGDGVKPLINLIKWLGKESNRLFEEKYGKESNKTDRR